MDREPQFKISDLVQFAVPGHPLSAGSKFVISAIRMIGNDFMYYGHGIGIMDRVPLNGWERELVLLERTRFPQWAGAEL